MNAFYFGRNAHVMHKFILLYLSFEHTARPYIELYGVHRQESDLIDNFFCHKTGGIRALIQKAAGIDSDIFVAPSCS